MEDAVEQLDRLARSVGDCTSCEELVAARLRAVAGDGHPHCAVMVVALSPDPADEAGTAAAGQATLDALAEFMPALATSSDKVYVTSLIKCVPRRGKKLREPRPEEQDACFGYLSREISITTPHYILAVGEETARYLVRRLFRDVPYDKGAALELRIFDNPAFKVVPVAAPAGLRGRSPKERKDYTERLRVLAQRMGL